MPVTDYTPEQLVERAVRNAKPHTAHSSPRWVAVVDTFALGSTYACELCQQYGLDPYEMVDGIRYG